MASKDIVPVAEVLNPQECWRLLSEASVGRLAVLVDGRPDIFPVNYKVDHESLVFRTGTGTKQQALDAESPLAFETDRVSAEFGVAWSVVVKGRAVRAAALDENMDALGRALFPWQGVGKDYLVRIVPETVTGRRFTISPGTWTTPLNDATRAGME